MRDNPGHPRLAGDADHFGDRRDEDDPVAALSAHMAGVESVERRGDAGARSSRLSTSVRTELWPMSCATVTPSRFASSARRYAARSTGPPPSWFTKTVVIPWVSIGAAAASAPLRASARPAWEWPSMNPGAA